jgi:hypothetical protein
MARDEAVLIKCYDSMEDGRARFTAHTAFDDPTTPPDVGAFAAQMPDHLAGAVKRILQE